MVLLICAVPCAATEDGWPGGDGERRAGRAIANDVVTSVSDLTGRWDGAWHSTRLSASGFSDGEGLRYRVMPVATRMAC